MSKLLSTKDKLLNVLKRHKEMTMKDIMEHFSISEIAVRRHLHELVQQGFVERTSNKQEIGRPFYTYILTGKGHRTFPNQDETLSLELLEDLESLYGEKAVADVLGKWKGREKKRLQSATQTTDFDEKIKRVAKVRHENGYMVEVDKTEDGDYVMKYFNCPVAKVACAYHHLCMKEEDIFKEIFSGSEISTGSMITKGDHLCKWTIKRPT